MRDAADMEQMRKRHTGRHLVVGGLLLALTAGSAQAGNSDLCFRGVNLSGAEYGEADGKEGINFTYPSQATVKYFADKGFDAVRLPFKWERLQRALGAPLDPLELERLKVSVAGLRAKGFTVILDPHNFGYYSGGKIGSAQVPARQFAQLWIRLAAEFANQDGIVFGLMNEPYDIDPKDWLDAANQAIAGIRAVKARNLILVPGTYWSGVSSWETDFGKGANGPVMLGVRDPIDNYGFEVHQYMDEDLSGTHRACVNADIAVNAIARLSEWLRTHDKRAFLGEFGGSEDPDCLAGLTRMTKQMADDSDVWLGWTYWAGGDWWPEGEGNNIKPTSKGDRKQLSALVPNLSPSASKPGSCAIIPPQG